MDNLKQKIRDRWGKGNNKMQFQLCQTGLKIINDGKRFICKEGIVTATNKQQIVCGDPTIKHFQEDDSTSFYLKPYSDKNLQQRYYIQMPVGEKHPRLKAVKINPKLWSYLLATVDKSDGYYSSEQIVWQIMAKSM